ncbi:MAG: hypothetical protein IR158_17665 [Cellulomonas sp.]|jgi:hypothetical protein|uniref:hypothetical protein n=1 Tax=Cellulomonas sp. TaxID=40001 RepID=UPI0019DD8D6A|nr:hypothetical protein [Cellulomonas sp.]MBF0689581.1 hypothetical protein [Cellulomonas sp.]
MGFFRRRDADPATVRRRQDEAIAAFWQWWVASGRAAAAEVFDDRADPSRLAQEIAPRLDAVHPGLQFETGAGRASRHVLVVTAAGDPDLRETADRWLEAAPAADASFEYDTWRRPVEDPAGMSLDLGGTRLDVGDVVVATTPAGDLTDVVAWHPAFADLPDEARGQITFLLLDAVLGERVVEEHLGAVGWASAEPADARPLVELRDLLGPSAPAP